MPNSAVVQSPPPVTQTGLTMTEQALLSEEEDDGIKKQRTRLMEQFLRN